MQVQANIMGVNGQRQFFVAPQQLTVVPQQQFVAAPQRQVIQINAQPVRLAPQPIQLTTIPPRRALTSAATIGRIITSGEVFQANKKALTIAAPQEARDKVRAFHKRQRQIEEAYFNQAQVCPIGTQKRLQDNLSKMKPQEFRA